MQGNWVQGFANVTFKISGAEMLPNQGTMEFVVTQVQFEEFNDIRIEAIKLLRAFMQGAHAALGKI